MRSARSSSSETSTSPADGSAHVVIAPDKFKGTLPAAEVAGHWRAGLERAVPGLAVQVAPVATAGRDAAVGPLT